VGTNGQISGELG